MLLADKQKQLIADLAALKSGQDRLALLVEQARKSPALPASERVEANLIPGCLAKLWFVAQLREGRCYFDCDSDSQVVKGVAGLLCQFYSDQWPAEIAAHDPAFLGPLGITQHLTPNRRNALAKVWERIRDFARQAAVAISPEPVFYDAHNHLQDERLGPDPARWLSVCRQAGIRYLVVNGACEADWPVVRELARQPLVLPSFGYHPWYLHERTAGWLEQLEIQLDAVPSAVGEIGLDRWKPDLPYEPQEAAFLAQLAIAARRNLPASIHCLQAWGRMLELLQQHPRPATGFLLHSYGGPPEMIPAFAKLGAYFSFPGYFLHPRKERQRQTFKHVPADRLLVETDAPDQSLPADKVRFPLPDQAGRPVNHPANLPAVYAGLAEWLAEPLAVLAGRVETNFLSLFGGVLRRQSGHHPAGGGKAESAGDKGG